jgi:hypothetical protein
MEGGDYYLYLTLQQEIKYTIICTTSKTIFLQQYKANNLSHIYSYFFFYTFILFCCRLGLGPTPLISVSNNRRSAVGSFFAASQGDSDNTGKGSKLARYQLRPAFIPSIAGAMSVACGEAHCVCALEGGT